MTKMIEYGDLSNDAKQVLKLTMVYPHLTSSLRSVMTLGECSYGYDLSYKNGLTELQKAGLIDLNSNEAANDKILTPLAYQIVPKEVLLLSLNEASRALRNLTEECTFTQRGRTIY